MAINQIRIDIHGRYASQDVINTYMYEAEPFAGPEILRPGNIITYQQLGELCDAWKVVWQGVYTSISVDGCAYDYVRVTALTAIRDHRSSASFPIAWTSGRVTPGLPPQAAAVVTRRWGNGQRTNNGRVYYAGIASADVVGGIIQAGSATWAAMQLAAVKMKTDLQLLGVQVWNPRIIAFRRPPPDGGFSYRSRPCSIAVPVPQMRSMRRRAPGHGRRG